MASESNKAVFTMPSDRELQITRFFDAPRDLVFKMWTDPAHIVQWWGPIGFKTESLEMDVRPGGIWKLVMHGPDGKDYQNKIVYSEVVKPKRLIYNHLGQDGTEAVKFQVTVTFEEIGEKTHLTMRMTFPSATERDLVIKRYAADKGAVQTIERLAAHIANTPYRKILITRHFDAPREQVFRAWTDPKALIQWWGPSGFTNPVCKLDVRVGGAIYIVMRSPEGLEHPMGGVFHEIVEPERLVFTLIPHDKDGQPLLEALTIATFAQEGQKTELTLEASAIGLAPPAIQMLAGMEMGWSQSLVSLASLWADN
jgi:uncharacterized protein YndB with AHSA1/START domain